ncbi:MAG: nucleotidyltransferase domain-containing protein [Leptolyngbya sp. SIO4C1]|nr:nucleotidyltransferase domain-containing protein [Leptolyngbya sp. SIO4C1]
MPTNLQFGLKKSTIQKIVDVLRQYSTVERAVLYGSRAKGNYHRGSDIDLTLVGEDISYQQLARIENQLDDLLLPYLFDLSIFSHIEDPAMIDHIERVGIVFYNREHRS